MIKYSTVGQLFTRIHFTVVCFTRCAEELRDYPELKNKLSQMTKDLVQT